MDNQLVKAVIPLVRSSLNKLLYRTYILQSKMSIIWNAFRSPPFPKGSFFSRLCNLGPTTISLRTFRQQRFAFACSVSVTLPPDF